MWGLSKRHTLTSSAARGSVAIDEGDKFQSRLVLSIVSLLQSQFGQVKKSILAGSEYFFHEVPLSEWAQK